MVNFYCLPNPLAGAGKPKRREERMRPVEEVAKKTLGLYDYRAQQSLEATKIVDATSICPQAKRCVIKYANDTRGLIAQICNWYSPDDDLGGQVHYFISAMTPVQLADDVVFERTAVGMRVEPIVLASFIYQNQP
ncbi:hypothetical protein [Spirosoma sp. KUDC1026]|uniref:hypothetical protein n=1 Tax=Spirosoma sp. KUDC1026 TaxID=2745947 RepID=UPI00159B8570|nr:hypothetical protein [Spirosoma sp. KUDC1026]QKZ15209.1 hypothetical protein HU175_22310 [Spirosoma sp. KUDC1026]